MAVNANALTTLAKAKIYLKIPVLEIAQDDVVELFINSSSEYIERECDRVFKAQAFTEIRHGRKQNILLLKQWPVNSITELRVDNDSNFILADTLVDAADYRVGDDSNSVILLNQVFHNGYNNIKVVYNAGFTTIPSDLEHACLWLVSWYHFARNAQDIGRPRRSKGDENFETLQDAPKDVRDCILRYKRTEMPVSDALTWNE